MTNVMMMTMMMMMMSTSRASLSFVQYKRHTPASALHGYDKRCNFDCPSNTLLSVSAYTPAVGLTLAEACGGACDFDGGCVAFVVDETAQACATKSSLVGCVHTVGKTTYYKNGNGKPLDISC